MSAKTCQLEEERLRASPGWGPGCGNWALSSCRHRWSKSPKPCCPSACACSASATSRSVSCSSSRSRSAATTARAPPSSSSGHDSRTDRYRSRAPSASWSGGPYSSERPMSPCSRRSTRRLACSGGRAGASTTLSLDRPLLRLLLCEGSLEPPSARAGSCTASGVALVLPPRIPAGLGALPGWALARRRRPTLPRLEPPRSRVSRASQASRAAAPDCGDRALAPSGTKPLRDVSAPSSLPASRCRCTRSAASLSSACRGHTRRPPRATEPRRAQPSCGHRSAQRSER